MKKTIIINAKNNRFGILINYIIKIININYKLKINNKYKIVLMNIKNINYTGSKLKNKIYYKHSRFPGGLKKINFENYIKRNNINLIKKSITGMTKKNKLLKKIIKKIKFLDFNSNKFNKIKPKIIINE